jgi:anti-anti-sigma factor
MSIDVTDVSAPTLTLRVSDFDDATVVRCCGKLTLETSAFLKREIKSRIPNRKRLVLDLIELTRMDSSGLGAIVGLYVSAKTAGCAFDLINASKPVQELLRLTNLLTIFETCGRQGIRMP